MHYQSLLETSVRLIHQSLKFTIQITFLLLNWAKSDWLLFVNALTLFTSIGKLKIKRPINYFSALTSFLVFEFVLVLAPLVLLLFVLPLMIGPNYRTWGLDVAKACFEGADWQGQPLAPIFGSEKDGSMYMKMKIPIIPRITYCDYHGLFGTSRKLTIRCNQDMNWHEKKALFIW